MYGAYMEEVTFWNDHEPLFLSMVKPETEGEQRNGRPHHGFIVQTYHFHQSDLEIGIARYSSGGAMEGTFARGRHRIPSRRDECWLLVRFN